ncbi:hypothetical protein B0H14DRAFT_3482523 [Mycena olivaceomarginata]|nr:hypothetical protein B0H14DRAFT_3482523 [Mycena olivaceomarginata]
MNTPRLGAPGSDINNCREHKNKQNVKILSNSRPGAPETTFDDLVSYELRSAKAGGSPSTVKGIDRLEKGSAAQWKWRGKGLLMVATSRWQLLGFKTASSESNSSDSEWVVT